MFQDEDEIGVHGPPLPAAEYSKVVLATPVPPTSVDVEESETVPLRWLPGLFMPAAGGTVSIVHDQPAGDGSTLPATSVARTWKVCGPSPRVGSVSGDAQAA